ncbi:MAG TPA: nitrate- and nitrite sensing domain-containing protein [Micromonosporaceae bacterium]|nr:nitrate- and nitrite sensing domain-containing protein [Micromonosporaceae bacterium]
MEISSGVARHRRAAGRVRFWSVRTQLLAPILVATIGLGVLGGLQTASAVEQARDAARAKVLAGTATATVRLAHELDRELAETAALRQRGGRSGEALVRAQRTRVDRAMVRYREAAAAAGREASTLRAALSTADADLANLGATRAEASTTTSPWPASERAYARIVTALLALADALPAQLNDPRLAAAAREVGTVAAIEHYHALARDLLRPVFSRGALQPGELAAVASVVGGMRQREAEFAQVASPAAKEVYDRRVTGRDVSNSTAMRTAALRGDIEPAGLKVDADAWYAAQSNTIRRLNDAGLTLSTRLDVRAAGISAAAYRRAWLVGVGSASLALLALAAAVVLAVRTSRRLRRLRAAALIVAREELPERIAAVNAGVPFDPRGAADSPASATTRSIAASEDEVGEVADAFGSVHRTALRLAAEQAELRVDVARMAEIFARRIRTLITRQLRLLDEFERDETDPEALSRLFALDHVAARLRRNGENLLVLAGGEPGRPYASAFPLLNAVRAAASEIEDFQRIEAETMDVAVAGSAVGDLVHLLAELLENATAFSAPDTMVRVSARRAGEGVELRVRDSGIGMTEARLAQINARLASSAALSSAAAGTMGLYVVARLAARHGLRVRLHSNAHGTDAFVHLPPEVLVPLRPGEKTVAALGTTHTIRPTLEPAVAGQLRWQSAGDGASAGGTGDAAAWFKPYLSGASSRSPGQGVAAVTGRPQNQPSGLSAGPGAVPRPRVGPDGPGAQPGPSTPESSEPADEPNGASGLPRRRPGANRAPMSSVAVAPVPPQSRLDPDEIRSRLSALAEGVAAAGRRGSEPNPASKDR